MHDQAAGLWARVGRNLVKAAVCCAALGLWAGAAPAQESLPTLPDVMAQVQDTEVYLLGYVGRGPEGMVRFVPPKVEGNGFPVVFESDDDLDTKIKGCGFEGSGALPCKMAGYGYLNWDGAKLRVVVTSIETITPPAAME